jgi:adenine-specific DNA-methyltransferase
LRYIGNKTRLLPFIRRTLQRLKVRPGIAHDAFSGTAAVGRDLKEHGWRVVSSDLMTYSYVLQRAYVVASRAPAFTKLLAGDRDVRHSLQMAGGSRGATARLAGIGAYLARLEPEPGFVTRHFSPVGNRMYFTAENAGRIDAARRTLHEWRARELIDDTGYYLLLAALIEGADRVANTAGVYAAYIKSWQSNALRPLAIEPVPPVPGRGSSAHVGDAADVARKLGATDLLYLDPPYNARQYSGYYHVPEIIARGWFDEEPALRGKTGLLNDPTTKSRWCSPSKVGDALRELLAASRARHILVSYNSEGLLPASELKAALEDVSADGRVRPFTKRYKRYRADRDRVGRRYSGDWVEERLYYVKRDGGEGER